MDSGSQPLLVPYFYFNGKTKQSKNNGELVADNSFVPDSLRHCCSTIVTIVPIVKLVLAQAVASQ